jgi:DNA-binding beta-propeller fold protein YncE
MRKKWTIVSLTFSMLFILVGYNQCVVQQGGVAVSTQEEGEVKDISYLPRQKQDTSNLQAAPNVAVKNFEQINVSMSAVTGVEVTDSNVSNVYQDVQNLLPVGNDLKTFLSKDQVSVVRLASAYCDRLVNLGNLRSEIWPDVNFGQALNTAFSDDDKKLYVINSAMNRFWGSSVGQSRDTARTELLGMFNMLMQNEPNNSTSTRNMVKGVCIATLASANTILL